MVTSDGCLSPALRIHKIILRNIWLNLNKLAAGRPRQGNFKQIMLYLDPSETDKFTQSLPRHKSLSEVIREYIQDENARIESEKKAIGQGVNLSPIKTKSSMINKQTKLDIHFGQGFMDYENWEERQKLFNELAPKQRYDVMIALNRTQKAWYSLIRTEEARGKKT